MGKKKILFVYPTMMLGGSTTSMLSIFYQLDYTKYDVSLLLGFLGGEWLEDVPDCVHILPPAHMYQDAKQRKLHRLLSLRYMFSMGEAWFVGKIRKSPKVGQQYLEMKDVDFYRDIEDEYDVAIAFLEGQQCKYVANHVHAKRKIAWIHIDYKASGFFPKYDFESMKKFDNIVTVSDQCLKSYKEAFPELANRCICIENILSQKRLLELARKENAGIEIDNSSINLVTTCRISFSSKGLDRAVKAFARIRRDGVRNSDKLKWYIIGGGGDYDSLAQLIKENGLESQISLLGMKINPYPYLTQMDLFFLPSIWEGKPMAVTEGFLLGLPALITNYASAHEQVRNEVDGMVVENSEDGVYQGLKNICEHPEKIEMWKRNVVATNYSNSEDIRKVEAVIDGKMTDK